LPYNYLQLSGLLAQLAERLDDPGNLYWSQSELLLYVQETFRTWQAISGYWRGRMTFNTLPGITYYDLPSQLGSIIPYTLKDTDLNTLLAYHLIETPPTGGTWTGTDMFSIDDLTRALERRRNQFLVETGMVVTRSLFNWPAPPTPSFGLADTTIDVRRAAWVSAAGKYSTLWRSDEFGASTFSPGWNNSPQDPPSAYSIAAEPPVTLALLPPPLNPGQVELFSVLAGAPLNPAAGVLLGIPDNLAWIVKWGALADLLSKAGQAEDLQRAGYCEQRWREGINIARIHTSIVQAAINGVISETNALESLDAYSPGWENTAPGLPTSVALSAWNMLIVAGPPDAGPYSLQLDVVQNAPVPVLLTDYIQVGREELDVLIDYMEHLAFFKMGGDDFLGSTSLYDRMLRMGGIHNERLKASVNYVEPMADRAVREEILTPRRVPIEQGQGA